MDPGKLREFVDIYRSVTTPSDSNEPILRFDVWQPDVPASVKGLTAKQREIAQAAGTLATYDVRLRALGMEDLSVEDRIWWRHSGRFRLLEIESIVNIGSRDAELIVMCSEKVAQKGGTIDPTVA